MTEDEIRQVAADAAAESHVEGKGQDRERERIVAYLRSGAENSTDADTLNAYADYIEAGLHWEDTGHDDD